MPISADFSYLYPKPAPRGCHYPHAMKIRKSPLPPHSILSQYTADYTDCFRGEFPGTERIPPEKLMAAFWTTMPGWLAFLFKLRNLLVRPFGLKTETDSNREALKEALENGEGYGMMTVVAKTADEMVVSLDDKHLKAWFSVCIGKPEHLPQYAGAIPQQTGSRLFHADPPDSTKSS